MGGNVSSFKLPSESRVFRAKGLIHPFVWSADSVTCKMKEGCWCNAEFWGWSILSGTLPLFADVLVSSPLLPHLLICFIPHFCCGTEFSSPFICSAIHLDKIGIIDICSHKSCVIVKWLDIWVSCFTPFQILYAISFNQYDFIIIPCNTLGIIHGIALGPLFLWTWSAALSCAHLES